jgi:hypothetical protein
MRKRSPRGRRNKGLVPPPASVSAPDVWVGVKGLRSLHDGCAALDTSSEWDALERW